MKFRVVYNAEYERYTLQRSFLFLWWLDISTYFNERYAIQEMEDLIHTERMKRLRVDKVVAEDKV